MDLDRIKLSWTWILGTTSGFFTCFVSIFTARDFKCCFSFVFLGGENFNLEIFTSFLIGSPLKPPKEPKRPGVFIEEKHN